MGSHRIKLIRLITAIGFLFMVMGLIEKPAPEVKIALIVLLAIIVILWARAERERADYLDAKRTDADSQGKIESAKPSYLFNLISLIAAICGIITFIRSCRN
jgi:hypothetical protein